MTIRSARYKWSEIIKYHGSICVYCREQPATTVDHVVPYSWDSDNNIDNLVPSCTLCNLIASNKVFECFEDKRTYILSRRKGESKRTICTDCLLPYAYLEHSPSLFLCPECYDFQYDTEYSKSPQWKNWLKTLELAGISPTIHRTVCANFRDAKRSVIAKLIRQEHDNLLVQN